MSTYKENLEIANTTGENEEEIRQEISFDEIADMLETVENEDGLILDMENLYDITINENLFAKGVKSISELCGQFAALRSVGMTEESASTLLINRETAKHNLDIAKIQESQEKIKQELNSI